MKKIFYLAIVLLFVSCKKESECCSTGLPQCLEQQITSDIITKPTVIRIHEFNNEKHYWINTGANDSDGDEFIVNEQCDTVCAYRGWFPDSCASLYTRSNWTKVW